MPENPFDLTDLTILMTGATGILGETCTRSLAEAGARLIVVDTSNDLCLERAQALPTGAGQNHRGVAADISDEESVNDLAQLLVDENVTVDVLINAAATKSENFFAPLEEFSLEDWNHVMSVNVGGIFLMCRAFIPEMADRGRGCVVNFGSIYGVLGPDFRIYEGSNYDAMGGAINTPLVYSASKGAVSAMTRHIATTYGAQGIRANTLIPGGVSSGQNTTFSEKYSARVPLNRMAEASDIANALVFLCSEGSAYMNGQDVLIDGGLSAW